MAWTLALVLQLFWLMFRLSGSSISQHLVHSPDDYVSHVRGNFPLILSVPHGGGLRPGSIPNRHNGCLVAGECVYNHECSPRTSQCRAAVFKDTATREIAVTVWNEVLRITGRKPHMIINELHRSKMDANRAIDLATFRNDEALNAYGNYTMFIHEARTRIALEHGDGLFLDIHGQSHSEGWTELGYTISRNSLNADDYDVLQSSIRALAERKCGSADVTCQRELISGDTSLGSYLQEAGLSVVPGPGIPSPGSGNYYSGGYNTRTYGSRCGNIDAIQIEIPRPVRFGDFNSYATILAQVIVDFMDVHGYFDMDDL